MHVYTTPKEFALSWPNCWQERIDYLAPHLPYQSQEKFVSQWQDYRLTIEDRIASLPDKEMLTEEVVDFVRGDDFNEIVYVYPEQVIKDFLCELPGIGPKRLASLPVLPFSWPAILAYAMNDCNQSASQAEWIVAWPHKSIRYLRASVSVWYQEPSGKVFPAMYQWGQRLYSSDGGVSILQPAIST